MFDGWLLRTSVLQQQSYGTKPQELEGEPRVEYVRWNVLAAMRELGETLNEVKGWKPWATKRDDVGDFKNRDDYVEELVDTLHFIANLLCVAGVTDTELSEAYERKMAVNAARQSTAGGYAGDGKAWNDENLKEDTQ